MKLLRRIWLIWGVAALMYFGALFFLPHRENPPAVVINRVVQVLLLVTSFYLVKRDPNKKNKFIFLNFLPVFLLPMIAVLFDFVGSSLSVGYKFAGFYFSQYYHILYTIFFSLAIVYLVFDLLFHEFKVMYKYALSLLVVLSFSGVLFYEYVLDPQYLYSREEIKQWKVLSSVVPVPEDAPSAAEIGSQVNLQSWENGKPIGQLYEKDNIARIEELLPYTVGDNWQALFWKPIYDEMIKMNVMLIGFVILFFGYQYKKDPPQGAYVDKIMFLMLLFISMEILHYWGYIHSIEWQSFKELFSVGQYVSVFIECLMVLFFMLRLQFITSVQGEFYETELASNPQQISRWRDWVDNWVLAHFFSFKAFNGRLFEKPSQR